MDFFEELGDGFENFGNIIGDHLLRLIGAIAILVIGWWLARLIASLIDQPAVGKFFDLIRVGHPLREAGYEAGKLLAGVVSGLVILGALVLAAEATNVQTVETGMVVFTRFIPRLIGAIVILMLTVAGGRWFAGLLAPYGESRDFNWLPRLARWTFYILGAIAALDLVGVDDAIGELIRAVVAAILVILVIAYGVGGINHAREKWAARSSAG